MKVAFLTIFISAFLCAFQQSFSQRNDSTARKMVKYTPDFEFKEGIYLHFKQVKNNRPIPKSWIMAPVDYNDSEFFEKVLLEKETISLYDENGMKVDYPIENIWGFSKNGVLYINWNGNFNRVPIIGSISHFTASLTVQTHVYTDPYYNYRYPYSSSGTQTSTELRQYILNWETGEIYDFNYENVEALLVRNEQLFAEFSALRKKKKKQLKFLYLRKFNKKHPIYLPVEK